jgi:hypothetical protein
MASKSIKENTKNTCQHIIKRGSNKGTICGKNCRGIFCKEHNDKKINYKKNYNDIKNQQNRKKALTEKIKNITNDDNDFPDIIKLQLQQIKFSNEIELNMRYLHGYYLAIDPSHVIPPRKNVINEMNSKKFKKRAFNEFSKINDKDKKGYGDFEGYLERIKERFLTLPNTYIIPKPFNGPITIARKKISEVLKKNEELREKINVLGEYIKEVETKINDMNNIGNDSQLSVEV